MHLPIRCLRLILLAVAALPSVHAASDKKGGQHALKASIDNAKAREACPDYTAYARHRQYVSPIPEDASFR